MSKEFIRNLRYRDSAWMACTISITGRLIDREQGYSVSQSKGRYYRITFMVPGRLEPAITETYKISQHPDCPTVVRMLATPFKKHQTRGMHFKKSGVVGAGGTFDETFASFGVKKGFVPKTGEIAPLNLTTKSSGLVALDKAVGGLPRTTVEALIHKGDKTILVDISPIYTAGQPGELVGDAIVRKPYVRTGKEGGQDVDDEDDDLEVETQPEPGAGTVETAEPPVDPPQAPVAALAALPAPEPAQTHIAPVAGCMEPEDTLSSLLRDWREARKHLKHLVTRTNEFNAKGEGVLGVEIDNQGNVTIEFLDTDQ